MLCSLRLVNVHIFVVRNSVVDILSVGYFCRHSVGCLFLSTFCRSVIFVDILSVGYFCRHFVSRLLRCRHFVGRLFLSTFCRPVIKMSTKNSPPKCGGRQKIAIQISSKCCKAQSAAKKTRKSIDSKIPRK
jgi:hypothetical protein